ncbi:hypothetical protein TSTA_066410 [Talaromyces stipitatus ATCC 10500]|nr:uncharacterized protein TSTA_066410 [Talaromyces stipitatus ATCC 10500]XP_002340581.1 uncharacterized protein TSTA_066410 [Talaromyces stipitatus ATCC 10500]EED23192.1 hypothetical protein TSTA_066410 [Talaromyces stipitatus ATCC 10500]EED23194.1 hypothetical protein TSTA_066410 [Talaromyces stipitatus ATCC 10500]
MQGLRRHFQQHVTCEEVCVCCFKVFRTVSEFIRHADKHDGAGERKQAFIKKTCDELRDQSDKQLALATSQSRSVVVAGEKRTWDVAALSSEFLEAQPQLDRTGVKTLNHHHITEGDSLNHLDPTCIGLSAPPISMQSPMVIPRLTMTTKPVNNNSSPHMSTEGVYFNTGEGQIQGLDLLQDFDAPILQIMNSVPALTAGWTVEDAIVDITANTDAPVYSTQ